MDPGYVKIGRKPLKLQDAREIERLMTLSSAVSVESQGGGTVTYERRKARGVWVVGSLD